MSKAVAELNIEAFLPTCIPIEQALLGRLLTTNAQYAKVSKQLKSMHFTHEHHQIIYEAMGQLIAIGKIATPLTLKPYLVEDEERGKEVIEYLAGLVSNHECAISSVVPYAAEIIEYHARREIVRHAVAQIKRAGIAEFGVSLADLLNDHDGRVQALRPVIGSKQTGFLPMSKLARETAQRIQDEWNGTIKRNTISTGYPSLDVYMGGMEATDLVVVAGRPASGKTSLGIDLLFNAAHEIYEKVLLAQERGEQSPLECVAAFSIEMSDSQLVERMFSRLSGVTGTSIRRRKIDRFDMQSIWDSSAKLEKFGIEIDADGSPSIADICARARELNRKKKIRLLLIDYLQLIKPFKTNARRDIEISEITAAIKALAKEIGCPIIVLSQVKREVDDRPAPRIPRASDMAEGGATENNADTILTIHRAETYLIQSKPEPGTDAMLTWEKEMRRVKGVADVFLAKSRHGGQDVLKMGYDGPRTTFLDKPADREPEPIEAREEVKRETLSPLGKALREVILDISLVDSTRPTASQREKDRALPGGARLVLRDTVKAEFRAKVRPDDDDAEFKKKLDSAFGNLRSKGLSRFFQDKDGTNYIYLVDTIAD